MIEILFGAQVDDATRYAEYRAAIAPLLEARGGRFVLDVMVAEVLRSPTPTRMKVTDSRRSGSRCRRRPAHTWCRRSHVRSRSRSGSHRSRRGWAGR